MPSFTAKMLRLTDGFINFHYIVVPPDIAAELLQAGHRRLLVTANGRAYRRGLVPSKAHGETVQLGLEALKFFGLQPGETASWTVVSDPEPDNLEIPDELSEWLLYDEEAKAEWDKLTPGKQRSLGYYVRTAKRPESRLKRTEEMMRRLKAGLLYAQQKTGKWNPDK